MDDGQSWSDMASRDRPSDSKAQRSRWRVVVACGCNVDVDVGRLLEYGNILEKEGKSGKSRNVFGYSCLFEDGFQKWCAISLDARFLPP